MKFWRKLEPKCYGYVEVPLLGDGQIMKMRINIWLISVSRQSASGDIDCL